MAPAPAENEADKNPAAQCSGPDVEPQQRRKNVQKERCKQDQQQADDPHQVFFQAKTV